MMMTTKKKAKRNNTPQEGKVSQHAEEATKEVTERELPSLQEPGTVVSNEVVRVGAEGGSPDNSTVFEASPAQQPTAEKSHLAEEELAK